MKGSQFFIKFGHLKTNKVGSTNFWDILCFLPVLWKTWTCLIHLYLCQCYWPVNSHLFRHAPFIFIYSLQGKHSPTDWSGRYGGDVMLTKWKIYYFCNETNYNFSNKAWRKPKGLNEAMTVNVSSATNLVSAGFQNQSGNRHVSACFQELWNKTNCSGAETCLWDCWGYGWMW